MPNTRDPELTRLLTMELERHLIALDANSFKGDPEALESTRRSVHALKGSAGLAGEPELASAMQRLERRLREGDHSALGDIVETVKRAIRRLAAGETAVAIAWPEPPPDLQSATIEPVLRSQYLAELTDRLAQIDECLGRTGDPLDAAAAVYRHVHTMKGAASAVGDEPTAWFCHGLEESLRGASATALAATTALQEVAKYRAVLGGLLDEPDAALARLRGLSGRPRALVRPPAEEDARSGEGDATIRVPAQSVDSLLDHIGGIAVARERVGARVVRASAQARILRKTRAELAEALRLIGPPRPWGAPAAALRRVELAAQTLVEMSDELDLVSEQLEQSDEAIKDNAGQAKKLLSAMRQTPIRGMFARLSAAALAEARRTGRLLAVRTVGADEPIDRRLAEQLVEPCLQLTRNAIAHGIEPPDAREVLQKPREATLTFTARKLASRLVVTISDDGAGVDVAAVRARAVESGVVTEVLAEAADDQTLLELLFLPGFSTRGQSPDLLAGRGIGLDIPRVRPEAGRLDPSLKPPQLGFRGARRRADRERAGDGALDHRGRRRARATRTAHAWHPHQRRAGGRARPAPRGVSRAVQLGAREVRGRSRCRPRRRGEAHGGRRCPGRDRRGARTRALAAPPRHGPVRGRGGAGRRLDPPRARRSCPGATSARARSRARGASERGAVASARGLPPAAIAAARLTWASAAT